MEADATKKSRLAVLFGEIDLIHFSNMTYWRQKVPSRADKAGYYCRQDRLEELRGKLADLTKPHKEVTDQAEAVHALKFS